DGSPQNPYRIATAEDLNDIDNHPNDLDKHFVMVADINLADYACFGPKFNMVSYITGIFDGNGHTICGYTGRGGIFGGIAGPNAVVRDLTLVSPRIYAPYGYLIGSAVDYLNRGSVLSCKVIDGVVEGGDAVGGLVGKSEHGGLISNCHTTAFVMGLADIGGLVGENAGGSQITGCSTAGSVSGLECTGGLVGRNLSIRYDDDDCISNCRSDANVSGTSYTGGIVGLNASKRPRRISNCIAAGAVRGNSSTGGLAGSGSNFWNCCATGPVDGNEGTGGLVGSGGRTRYCYATGPVRGNIFTGGLIGGGGGIWDSYATGAVHGSRWTGGLSGAGTGVYSSFAAGPVRGDYFTGGLTGMSSGYIFDSYATGAVDGNEVVGGLVGHKTYWGDVVNSYAAGSVSGDTSVGGLIGYDDDAYGQYAACFWDSTVNDLLEGIGNGSDPNVTGRSTEEMMTKGTFADAGWDFTTPIWTINEGRDYPRLWWQPIQAQMRISPAALNLQRKARWLTCCFRLPDGFNVPDIDPCSVVLSLFEYEIEPAQLQLSSEARAAIIKFDCADIEDLLKPGEIELTVTWALTNGVNFEAAHTITVIDKRGQNGAAPNRCNRSCRRSS
ncbi:MAG: hypothetical protein ACYTBJ_25645, partial [Planctomycetota bacterium]